MMSVAILVLCAGLGSGQSVTMIPQALEDSATGGIRAGNSAAQLGGSLTSQGSSAFTNSAKQFSSGISALNAAALQGGVDIFRQLLNIGGRFASTIPLLGPAVGMGTSALQNGAKLFNTVGQNLINTTQNLVNTKLNVIDGIVQAGTGAFMNAANVTAALASQGVQSAVKTLNDVVPGSNAVFDPAIGGSSRGKPATTTKPMFNPDKDLFY